MTPEQYLDALLALPGLWGAQVSPDGKWVAWTWFRTDPAAEVYVAPTDASAPPVRLTSTPETTMLVSWTPDSRAVLVEEDKDGNERTRLFRVYIDQPHLIQPLTEDDPNYFIRGGQLHPNAKWLVYAANIDLQTKEEIEPSPVIRHDLISGERIALSTPLKGTYVLPELSPSGEYVLYNRSDYHASGQQIWLAAIDGSSDREIYSAGEAAKAFGSWFPDGQRILILAETDTHKRIGVRTVEDETIRWLLDDSARAVESAFVPMGSEQIVVLEVRDARLHASLLDPQTGAETPFPRLPGTLRPLAPTDSGEWVGVYFSSKQPTDVVRFSLDAGSADDLTSISRVWERTTLTPDDLTQAEDFRWQSEDGLSVQGWLYRAQGEARGTVLYVHGGPTAHSADAINNQIQYFVRCGFNVLDPNYRGSTGFGLQFREAIKAHGWGGMEQVDIRTGIEALIAQGIAQPQRVGITGTSYGGYSSWHAITHFSPDVLAASAPICGMTDLVVDYETTRPDLRPYSEEMMGGTPQQVPDRYFERSPINFVQQIQGRLMIIQGMQDPNVHPDNVAMVKRKLDEAGIEYELLAFDDEGHGIIKPPNQKKLNSELARFFGEAFSG